MLFIDFDNFIKSIEQTNKKRKEKISRFSDFIINYLNEKKILKLDKNNRIRTYSYTGEFTDSLIDNIKRHNVRTKINSLDGLLNYAKKQKEWQTGFFNVSIGFDSFEFRTKPLQFGGNKIFQKGVDVQIAVDMITHAYNKSYDVAILCSGDIDLIESVKVIKNLGKKVVVCSHSNCCSKNMMKEADVFIDMKNFNDAELNEFTVKKS